MAFYDEDPSECSSSLARDYPVSEFFPSMESNWEKASRCLQPILPRWIQSLMYGKVLSRNNVKIIHQYEALAEVQKFVSKQLQHNLQQELKGGSQVTVSAAYCKVEINGIVSFGAMINISQINNPDKPRLHRTFEGFVNFQDRTKWDIMETADADDRSINDPAWLIPSTRARQNGHPEFPMAMRLDMAGQYLVEKGWTAYRVLGQQLLLTVELVIKKGQ